MKQPPGQRSNAWFWVGFVLLSISISLWAIIIYENIGEGDIGGTILEGVIFTAIPTGIGIYGIWRGITKDRVWIVVMIYAAFAAFFGGVRFYVTFEKSNEVVAIVGALAIVVGMGLLAEFARQRIGRLQLGLKSFERAGAELKVTSDDYVIATSGKAILTYPDRNVAVDVVEEVRSTGEKVPYTRIRVEYRGRIPCIIQMRNLAKRQIDFFEKDVYMEWTKEICKEPQPFEPPLKVPKTVTIHGRRVSTAPAKTTVPKAEQWVLDILGDPNVARIQGIVRIEPSQILWWRRGSMLPRQWLEDAIDGLVHLARISESEKEHGVILKSVSQIHNS